MNIDDDLWNNWKWQISNYLSSYDDIKNLTNLSLSEIYALKNSNQFGTSISELNFSIINLSFICNSGSIEPEGI